MSLEDADGFPMPSALPTFPGPEPKYGLRMFGPTDLKSTGVLWLINRVVFHPRGLALAMNEQGGWCLQASPDGSPFTFDLPDNAERDLLHDVEQLIDRAKQNGRVPW